MEEETYLCPSETAYIRPLRAINTDGKWRVIINNLKQANTVVKWKSDTPLATNEKISATFDDFILLQVLTLIETLGAASDLSEDDDVVALEADDEVVRHDAVGAEEAAAVEALGDGSGVFAHAAGAAVAGINVGVDVREHGRR